MVVLSTLSELQYLSLPIVAAIALLASCSCEMLSLKSARLQSSADLCLREALGSSLVGVLSPVNR